MEKSNQIKWTKEKGFVFEEVDFKITDEYKYVDYITVIV